MTIGAGNNGAMQVGGVKIVTTQNTGLSVEHWAERALDKIIWVGDGKASPIKDQAIAYKDDLRRVLVEYIGLAVKSDRTTLYNLLLKQGETEMAEVFRKLGHGLADTL